MDINSIGSNINLQQPKNTLSSQEANLAEDLMPKDASELNKQNKEDIQKQLSETVEELNSQLDLLGTDLKFGFNDKIDIMYVNVHEKSSGKLIRKFPTDEAMRLAEHMKEFVGILFDKKG